MQRKTNRYPNPVRIFKKHLLTGSVQTAQTLLGVLGELDDDYRTVLVLYYMEDLSYKEIAEVLAVPLGTVQSRIARAKAQLLRRLTKTQFRSEESK